MRVQSRSVLAIRGMRQQLSKYPARVAEKLGVIRRGGSSKLHIVVDFDRTVEFDNPREGSAYARGSAHRGLHSPKS